MNPINDNSTNQINANVSILQPFQIPNGFIKPLMLASTPAVAKGDIYYSDANGIFARLPVGNANQVLTVIAGIPTWQAATFRTDGFILISDIWVYASAFSFTITGVDRTAVYPKGTRVAWSEDSGATYKYGVVISSSFSSDTTINLASNIDFSMTNTPISNTLLSYEANPQGFPYWFNFTPTITNPTGATGALGVNYCKFRIIGKEIVYIGNFNTGTIGGTITGDKYTFTTPIAFDLSSYAAYAGWGHLRQGGSRTPIGCYSNNTTIDIERYDDVTISNTTVEVTFGIIYSL